MGCPMQNDITTGEDIVRLGGIGVSPDVVGGEEPNATPVGGGKTEATSIHLIYPGQADQKGEMISPLLPSPLTELPPDFDFIASKTDDEKIEYIQSVLARSEDEAIAVIAPALRLYGTAGSVVEAYLPLILEVKKHLCRPGRPKVDPATGGRSKTWEEVCKEHFYVGIRRMQQILASFKEPKLLGTRSATSPKAPIDRREYERAKQVAAPATTLAAAVVKNGLGGTFPEALEILKLANVPVPTVKPAAVRNGVNEEPDWKAVLAGVLDTLERYGDRLPIPVIKVLKSTKELLGGKAGPLAATAGTRTAGKSTEAHGSCTAGDGGTPEEPLHDGTASEPGSVAPQPSGSAASDPPTDTSGSIHALGPTAEGRGDTPTKKGSPEYKRRKTEAQRRYIEKKKVLRAARAAKSAAPQEAGPRGKAGCPAACFNANPEAGER